MLKPLYAAMLTITSLTFSSCQPDPEPEPEPVTEMHLFHEWEFASAHTWVVPHPPVFNVNGLLVQSKITAYLTETDTINITRYRTKAEFKDLLDFIAAGDVAMNGIVLPMGYLPNTVSGPFTYIHQSDTGFSHWNENAGNTWTVSGAGIIPQISYTLDNTFPEYTAALPTAIDTNSDLTITFNSGNVQNGDFAMITIAGEYGHGFRGSEVVPVNGGTAIIPANTFKYMARATGKGSIAVHIYKQYLETFDGKPFAFVKLRDEWGTVTFH